tara:strand:- start:302 stop:442 length:141 start_codon:yes stop_codon:yes gene_type:complete
MTVVSCLAAFALGVSLGIALIPTLQAPEPLLPAAGYAAQLVELMHS